MKESNMSQGSQAASDSLARAWMPCKRQVVNITLCRTYDDVFE